ncbi:hypothetical protein [Kitasatospora sp. NPDC093102]|uniref:hypothetical protein n=1 Tax=Kitasatospora sp. NPDC093102 TaxID=3155069 RepID=UPI003428F4BD
MSDGAWEQGEHNAGAWSMTTTATRSSGTHAVARLWWLKSDGRSTGATASRTRGTNSRRQAVARPERPAWRDPGRMLGAVLANAGSGLAVAVLLFLVQHVEVVWR